VSLLVARLVVLALSSFFDASWKILIIFSFLYPHDSRRSMNCFVMSMKSCMYVF